MRKVKCGELGEVSRLTLGGGGIGQFWGVTTREEAIATIRMAMDNGITLIDTAPVYANCEEILAETFAGKLPHGVRITSKSRLGNIPPSDVEAVVRASLEKSLRTMRIDHIDAFFLHTNICDDGYVFARNADRQDSFATPWSVYVDAFIPTMEKLVASGLVGHWGITAIGVPQTLLRAINQPGAPAVIQAVSNLLDSPGGMQNFDGPAEPRRIIEAARSRGIGVMGIRAVQAGALTLRLDRDLPPDQPEARDYRRAAPFRALCRELGQDPAVIAHRYALGIDGVNTLILGIKNRAELAQCLEAEASGPLEPALMERIDALRL